MVRSKKKKKRGQGQSATFPSSSANKVSELARPQASSKFQGKGNQGIQGDQGSSGSGASQTTRVFQVIDSDDNGSEYEEGEVVDDRSRVTRSAIPASTSTIVSSYQSGPPIIPPLPMQAPPELSNASQYRNLAIASQRSQRGLSAREYTPITRILSQSNRSISDSSTRPRCE